MIYILLLIAILGFIAAGVWYASQRRRPKPLPPPVVDTLEPTIPTVFRRTDGHIYRMRLPDRLRMEHHRSTR